jgi:hypothetical protein
MEAFNTLKNPQFGTPSQVNFNNRTEFNRITSLRHSPRLVQLSPKFYF